MTQGYTIKAATEWGIGGSVNGLGKRQKVSGYYVVSPRGRRVRAFTGPKAEEQAAQWAIKCDEMQAAGQINF